MSLEAQLPPLFERLGYKIVDRKHQKLATEEIRTLLGLLDKSQKLDDSMVNSELEEEWDGGIITYIFLT